MTFSAPDLDTLAREWPLAYRLDIPQSGACIVVAGAYQGKVIRLLHELYPSHGPIFGYEPQRWAFEDCLRTTLGMHSVYVAGYGLLAEPKREVLDMGEFYTDACSVLAQGDDSREHSVGTFVDANAILSALPPIDLFIMNMEGYEYPLLEYLCDTDPPVIDRIARLAVQFHTKYEPQFYGTMQYLDALYRRVYDDFPKWVYWEKQ